MKTIIFYKSFLGTTRKYAEWLKAELKCDLKKFKEASDEELKNYDLIIVVSGTYAGRMPLTGFLKSKWEILKDKEIVAIGVGIAPENVYWSRKSYDKIPLHIREKIRFFKIPGRIGPAKPAGEVRKENLEKVIQYLKSLLPQASR
ncbi:MAG: flavodoxin family protein [Thermoproteota archaeon]